MPGHFSQQRLGRFFQFIWRLKALFSSFLTPPRPFHTPYNSLPCIDILCNFSTSALPSTVWGISWHSLGQISRSFCVSIALQKAFKTSPRSCYTDDSCWLGWRLFTPLPKLNFYAWALFSTTAGPFFWLVWRLKALFVSFLTLPKSSHSPTYLDLHSRGWNAISISDLDLKTQNGAKRPCIPAQIFLFVYHKIELIHSFQVMLFLCPKVAWKFLKL